MNGFIAFPTWIITRLLGPFLPVTHPWYGRKFTLQHWASHQTSLCRVFDYALWVWLPLMIVSFIWFIK